MPFASKKIIAACWLAAVLTLWQVSGARANEQNAPGPQNTYQASIPASVRLQVTGTGSSLSLDAERSDVLSTLRAVLKQAGKQFIPDATVTGQVTLLLTDQSLDTILRAICEECYLKYVQSPSGIYRFTRDDAAVRNAFTKLKQLNSQLRAQLRSLGVDVPADDQPGNVMIRERNPSPTKTIAPETEAIQNGTKSYRGGRSEAANPASAAAQPGGAPAGTAAATPAGPAASKRETQKRIANIHADFVPQGEMNQFLKESSRGNAQLQDTYGLFVRQNGLVWFNIPEEKPEPVASVLQLFSQQANVPILVDQSIPNSLKFRVWGSLSPRQLPEALNVLAPTAHLQWRWIGNTVFVVPAPNFLVYFGDQGSTRNSYPAQQRSENSAGADTKDKKGGSD